MKRFVKIVLKGVMAVVMIAYIPLFFIGWVLHKVARLLLATAYCLLLDFQKAADIIRYLMDYRHK